MHDGRFPFEVVSGVPVVAAPEEIDITNAPELRSALLEAAAHGHGTLVADMTRTQFCDSSGLHTLLAAHKRAQAEGGELLLVIPAAAVLRVFAITGIDRMIPNFTSLDEALAQTSANESNGSNGPNGHRRADGGPEGSPALAGSTKQPSDRGWVARTTSMFRPGRRGEYLQGCTLVVLLRTLADGSAKCAVYPHGLESQLRPHMPHPDASGGRPALARPGGAWELRWLLPHLPVTSSVIWRCSTTAVAST